MKNIKDRIKEKFDYDVTALPAYVDAQSADIYADLLYGAGFTSRINVLENVKGSQTIKLLNSDLALQSGDACSTTESGTIVFDGKDISTKRLMVNTSLCNDTLEDTWAQLLLSIGANRQDRDLPLQDVLTAYIVKQTKAKNQDLIFKGDTTSANADLAHYDGLIKLWDNDANVVEVTTTETAIDATNGFDLAKKVYDAIPAVLFDNGASVEIITGRAEANAILSQIYNDKDYASTIAVTEEGSEMSFVLPTTNITVRTYPQLNGLGKMYAVPYSYVFFGTDLESDLDGLTVKYLEESEKIRVRNLFRSGVQYVYSEYFVKLTLA
jgi:hypothetical protein